MRGHALLAQTGSAQRLRQKVRYASKLHLERCSTLQTARRRGCARRARRWDAGGPAGVRELPEGARELRSDRRRAGHPAAEH
eukprot:scaffold33929_cov63-Phaeocystis_antarctica.AAC.2